MILNSYYINKEFDCLKISLQEDISLIIFTSIKTKTHKIQLVYSSQ